MQFLISNWANVILEASYNFIFVCQEMDGEEKIQDYSHAY